MIESFLKRIKLSDVKHLIFAVSVIAIVSIIPLLKSYGRINIGSDTFIPFLPEHSHQMTYEWLDRNNGEYYTNTYRVWLLILDSLKKIGLSIYQAGFILQFLIFSLSGFGMYKIFSVIDGKYSVFGLIPAIFYILSPHLFDHQLYQIGTIGVVWITYYFIKFVKLKKFTFSDAVFINIFLGTIIDLPNPKYHFLIFLTSVFILLFSLLLKIINIKDIVNNLKYFISIVLLSSYILLPMLFFGYSFSKYNYEYINVKASYGSSGETLDYGVAQINKMMRLFHTPNLEVKTGELINTLLYFLAYYMIPIFILGIFPFIIFKAKRREKKFYLMLYCISLILIFLAKGSNPPFGFLYERILSSIQLFAFMRTTAGIVIYAALFYALIYGILISYLFKHAKPKYVITIVLFSFILIWGYPIWSGRYFLNRFVISTQKSKYGLEIPETYYDVASALEPYKLDAKVGIFPSPSGYQQNTWGYYGFILYPWLVDKPTLLYNYSKKEDLNKSRVNLRFIMHDKSTLLYGVLPEIRPPLNSDLIFQSKMIDVYRLPDFMFLPHFYISENNYITNKIPQSYLKAQNKNTSAYFSLSNSQELLVEIPKKVSTIPTLEYKKINPTKYRVVVRGAKDTFPLNFNENYRPEWKLYMGNINRYKITNKEALFKNLQNYYKIFKYNEKEQASINEILHFAKKDLISTVGDLEERVNKTFIYPYGRKLVKNVENYKIDFVSKNFSNSIQNNNLPDSPFYETLMTKEILNNHLVVNNYFNSWLIDVNKLCDMYTCKKNLNGGYDFELIAEFWPQKLLNLGSSISVGTLLVCFFFSFFKFAKKILYKPPRGKK